MIPEIVPKDFKPEWKTGISDEQYHADKTSVSSTGIRKALISPLHFYSHIIKEETEKTVAQSFGSLVHMFLLEPTRFRDTYIVMPDFGDMRSSKNREQRDLWLSDIPETCNVVKEEELEAMTKMFESVGKHPIAKGLIEGATFEQAGYFRDPETGLKGRIKTDILHSNLSALCDIKTTDDISRDAFTRTIWNYRYDIQMAYYNHGIKQIMGKEPDFTAIIAMEKKPPYDVAVYEMDLGALSRGENDFKRGLRVIAECVQTNEWPGYQRGSAQVIGLPAWTDGLEE